MTRFRKKKKRLEATGVEWRINRVREKRGRGVWGKRDGGISRGVKSRTRESREEKQVSEKLAVVATFIHFLIQWRRVHQYIREGRDLRRALFAGTFIWLRKSFRCEESGIVDWSLPVENKKFPRLFLGSSIGRGGTERKRKRSGNLGHISLVREKNA